MESKTIGITVIIILGFLSLLFLIAFILTIKQMFILRAMYLNESLINSKLCEIIHSQTELINTQTDIINELDIYPEELPYLNKLDCSRLE